MTCNPQEKRLTQITQEITLHKQRIKELKTEQNTILKHTNKETQPPQL